MIAPIVGIARTSSGTIRAYAAEIRRSGFSDRQVLPVLRRAGSVQERPLVVGGQMVDVLDPFEFVHHRERGAS